jgi:hypothetical protein
LITPQQQADKINSYVAKLNDLVGESFELATRNLETDIKQRVFTEHEDINNSKLGQYSTVPTLIGAKSFINKGGANTFFTAEKKKKPKGQWRTVKGKHLFVLDGGYKELRQVQGLQTSEVNLQYSGELLLNGIGVNIGENVYQVKFLNKLSTDKGRGFEQRRNKKIFYASEKEKEKALDFVGKRIINGLKEVFGNV